MSDEKGYIKLYRGITENFLWQAKATKLQAWLDLLMMVNYQDKKTLFNERVVTVKRGEIITSEVKLAARWGWNKRTVAKFLEVLESEEMVRVKKSHICTTIYVVNYCKYQGFSENSTQPNAQQTTQPSTQLTAQLNAHNIKKEEESKEGKRNNNKPPISPFEELDKTDFSENIKSCLREWFEYKKQKKEKSYQTEMGFKKFITQVQNAVTDHGEEKVIKQFDYAMSRGWSGAYLDKIKPDDKQQSFNMDDFLKRYDE